MLSSGDAIEKITQSFLQGAYHPHVHPRVRGSSPYQPNLAESVNSLPPPNPIPLFIFLGSPMRLSSLVTESTFTFQPI